MCPANIPPPPWFGPRAQELAYLAYKDPLLSCHTPVRHFWCTARWNDPSIRYCSNKRPYHGWSEHYKSPTAWSEYTVGTTAFLESELLLLGIRSTPHVARRRKTGFNRTVMRITVTSNMTGRMPHDRNVGLTFHPNTDSWGSLVSLSR